MRDTFGTCNDDYENHIKRDIFTLFTEIVPRPTQSVSTKEQLSRYLFAKADDFILIVG